MPWSLSAGNQIRACKNAAGRKSSVGGLRKAPATCPALSGLRWEPARARDAAGSWASGLPGRAGGFGSFKLARRRGSNPGPGGPIA